MLVRIWIVTPQVVYDDGDVGEFTDSELGLILQAPADQPRLPFMYSVDTFVVSEEVATTNNSRGGSRGLRLVTREIGGGRGADVICVEKNCETANGYTTCDHVRSVVQAFPLPQSWGPGTLECEVPHQHNRNIITGDKFRDVCHVNLLAAHWAGQPQTEDLLPPGFNVNGKFNIVAAVLSDVEGTFRIVKG